MGWLIDTSVWIAVERRRIDLADVHAITGSARIYCSPVNIAEIQTGWELLPAGPLRQRVAASLRRVRRLIRVQITQETGVIYGRLFATLERSGRSGDFRSNDLWLAAQAVQRDFQVLTANPKDFADVPGLKMVSIPIP